MISRTIDDHANELIQGLWIGSELSVMERLSIDGYSGMARMKRSLGRKIPARNLRDEVLHREACGQE